MNSIKTFGLMFVLILLFTWAGRAIGGQQGMVLAFVFAVGTNYFMYWFSDSIVLMMYKAKLVKEEKAVDLYKVIRNLTIKANLPMPKVYIIENPTPNAFATGRDPAHAAVAVTRGILDILNQSELEGVLAHELSHVKHRDILLSTIAATFAGAITMLARIGQFGLMFGGMGRDRDNEGGGGLGALLIILLAPLAAILIQMSISRSREYMADEGGAKITRHPLALANALKKLAEAGKQIPMAANPSTAHMFIVNPLTGGGLVSLFSTHPPMAKRIEILEKMEQDFKMSGMPKIIS
ncbi:MAG: zinc metalloprotease HtpX [bacterium]|nr:zinc metalloprotease HtpX [bacterium]MDD5353975.1 zinc metalloprotease HtpX [bacterium]MDD5756052.1 zinc metalloprotease HtpX [bacterium]